MTRATWHYMCDMFGMCEMFTKWYDYDLICVRYLRNDISVIWYDMTMIWYVDVIWYADNMIHVMIWCVNEMIHVMIWLWYDMCMTWYCMLKDMLCAWYDITRCMTWMMHSKNVLAQYTTPKFIVKWYNTKEKRRGCLTWFN